VCAFATAWTFCLGAPFLAAEPKVHDPRLDDNDGDGVSESRTRIAELRTSNSYPHSALLGITLGADGWLYVSRGNNGSAAYSFVGTDGSMVEGYGDGGNIFITDWVLVDYPNHGRGRIWRLSPKPNQPVTEPRPYYASPKTDTAFEPFKELVSARSANDLAKLEAAFRSDDAFLRHAAVVALSNPTFRERAQDASIDSDFRLRLGALLALRRAKADEAEQILKVFLRDAHSEIRHTALVWAGEQRFTNLREDLDHAIAGSDTSAALFETYLAAVEIITKFRHTRSVRL